MKQQELAEKMKVAKNVLSEIIHAKRNLTPALALKLEAALGIKAEFWMRLQVNYDINLIRNQYSNLLDKTNASRSKKAKLSHAIRKTSKQLLSGKKKQASR